MSARFCRTAHSPACTENTMARASLWTAWWRVDYPLEYFRDIRNASGHMDSPLARSWFEQRAPVFFNADTPLAHVSTPWLANFCRHDLRNAAADGVVDESRCIATYFSFHRLPEFNEVALRGIFKMLIPLMHEIFARVIQRHQERSASPAGHHSGLTPREQEIVAHISQGKSNAEIASLLHLSEFTVRNQVSRILEKTGCSNRVALAAVVAAQEQERHGLEIGTHVL
jgi:DNA-binding CsgD family transcriptional regulator